MIANRPKMAADGDHDWSDRFTQTIGMILAAKPDGRFNAGRGEASWVSRAQKISGLDAADAQILSDWLIRAGACGIDSVVDLSVRPWRVEGQCAIVGVFEKDKDRASWLIVRYRIGWVLISCADGFISDVSAALPDVLALIDAAS